MKWIAGILLFLVTHLAWHEQVMAQRLNWSSIDENQSHFGFVGYQGGRKNVCADRSGNLIYCSPFANTIQVGSQQHSANFETVIVKRNKDGQVIWSRTLSGTGFKSGHSIHADSIGNIYLLGWYYGNSSINGLSLYSYGNYDCFLVKLSSAGQIEYIRTFGGAGYDYPIAVTTDRQGNAYVSGKFSFSIVAASLSCTGLANSHFLLKVLPNGNVSYLRNTCTNGSGDWGKGDLAMGKDGKLYQVSNFFNTSTFDTIQLQTSGIGGYLARIEPSTGDVEYAVKAGTEACLIDIGLSGELIIGGWQKSNQDSMAASRLPGLAGGSAFYLARLTPQASLIQSTKIDRSTGGLGGQEDFRHLHIGTSGQLYLSGDLVSDYRVGGQPVELLGFKNGSTSQAALIKLEEDLSLAWTASASSLDTLGVPNSDFGCGIATDLQGNIFWLTSNFANSVNDTRLYLNQDTAAADSLSSRYRSYGVHIWSMSEPYIATQNATNPAVCPGDTVSVSFLKYGIFDPGNVFTAELSDSNGSFEFARTLGHLVDTSAGSIPFVVPFDLNPGFYYLRVNGSKPRVKGSAIQIPLQVRGKPVANAGADAFFCLGDTVLLNASGGGSYEWFGTEPLLDTFDAQVRTLPAQDAGYWVKVTDSLSSCFNLDSVEYTYRSQVSTAPLSDTVLCEGQSLNLKIDVLAGDSTRLTVLWLDQNNQVIGTSDSLAFIPTSSTRIWVEVWDSCSLLSDTQSFQLSLRPPLSVDLISDTLVCQSQGIRIAPVYGGGNSATYAFAWLDSTSSQLISTDSVPVLAFTSNQTLQLKFSDGCSVQSDSAYLHVRLPEPLQVSVLDSAWLCPGDSVQLTASVQGGYTGTLLYYWNGNMPSLDSQFWWKPVSTSEARLKVTDYCLRADSASTLATIRAPKQLTVRSDTLLCEGEKLDAWVTGFESDTGQYEFQWEAFPWGPTRVSMVADSGRFPRLRIRDKCSMLEFFDSFHMELRVPLNVQVPLSNPYCYGEQVNLKAQATGGLTTQHQLTWFNAQGLQLSQGENYSHRLTDSIAIYVILQDQCTQTPDTAFFTLYTRDPLKWGLQNDTQLCYGQTLALTPLLSGGLGTDYTWSLSQSDSLNLVQGQAYYQSKLIQIIGRDNCSEEVILRFQIRVSEPLSFYAQNDTFLCFGSPVSFSIDPRGGLPSKYDFTWQGIPGSRTFQIASIQQDTTIKVCLSDGCSNAFCDSFKVSVFSRKIAEIEGDTFVCFPEAFNWSSGYKSASASWRWTIPNALDTLSAVPALSWEAPKPGIYTIQLEQSDSNACREISGPLQVRVGRKPSAQFTLSSDFIVPNNAVEVVVQDQSIQQHTWLGPQVPSPLGALRFELVFSDTGNFNLTHIAANADGCLDSFSRELYVKDSLKCWLPNAFIPKEGGDGQYYLPQCTELADQSLKIYNRWGQLIFEAEGPEIRWDGKTQSGSTVPIGVYLFRFEAKNQRGERVIQSGVVNIIR